MSTHANEELLENLLEEQITEQVENFKQDNIRSSIEIINLAYKAFLDKE